MSLTAGRVALPFLPVALAALVCACGGDSASDGPSDPRRAGDACDLTFGPRCADGLECLYGVCSAPCDTDADCKTGVCGAAPDGKFCQPRCSDGSSTVPGYSCVDGHPTKCTEAGPGIDCDQCACGAELRCVQGQGCVALAEVGESCSDDRDCSSNHCSPYTGRCNVAVGERCTADNCDACKVLADWSYCSRECSSSNRCNGGVCVNLHGQYLCVRECTSPSSCPEKCSPLDKNGDLTTMCDCPSCSLLESPRPLGHSCVRDGQCESGQCFANVPLSSCAVDLQCSIVDGVCSTACADDTACADGSRCALGHCLVACTGDADCPAYSACSLQTADGTRVCDPRGGAGAGCNTATDCRAGTCEASRCRGPAGVGEACKADQDCTAGYCCSGACHSAC